MIITIVFGLLALGIPFYRILFVRAASERSKLFVLFSSFSSCGIAICSNVNSTNNFVMSKDWTALLDTHSFSTLFSALLLVSTMVLNFVVILKKN